MAKLIINFEELYTDYRKKAVISIESFNVIADLEQYLKEKFHIKDEFYLELRLDNVWIPSFEKISILKSGDEVRVRLFHPKIEDLEGKREKKKKRKLSLEPEPEVNELQGDEISLKKQKKKKRSTEDFDASSLSVVEDDALPENGEKEEKRKKKKRKDPLDVSSFTIDEEEEKAEKKMKKKRKDKEENFECVENEQVTTPVLNESTIEAQTATSSLTQDISLVSEDFSEETSNVPTKRKRIRRRKKKSEMKRDEKDLSDEILQKAKQQAMAILNSRLGSVGWRHNQEAKRTHIRFDEDDKEEETAVEPMEIPAQTSPNNFSKAFRDDTASNVGCPGTSSTSTNSLKSETKFSNPPKSETKFSNPSTSEAKILQNFQTKFQSSLESETEFFNSSELVTAFPNPQKYKTRMAHKFDTTSPNPAKSETRIAQKSGSKFSNSTKSETRITMKSGSKFSNSTKSETRIVQELDSKITISPYSDTDLNPKSRYKVPVFVRKPFSNQCSKWDVKGNIEKVATVTKTEKIVEFSSVGNNLEENLLIEEMVDDSEKKTDREHVEEGEEGDEGEGEEEKEEKKKEKEDDRGEGKEGEKEDGGEGNENDGGDGREGEDEGDGGEENDRGEEQEGGVEAGEEIELEDVLCENRGVEKEGGGEDLKKSMKPADDSGEKREDGAEGEEDRNVTLADEDVEKGENHEEDGNMKSTDEDVEKGGDEKDKNDEGQEDKAMEDAQIVNRDVDLEDEEGKIENDDNEENEGVQEVGEQKEGETEVVEDSNKQFKYLKNKKCPYVIVEKNVIKESGRNFEHSQGDCDRNNGEIQKDEKVRKNKNCENGDKECVNKVDASENGEKERNGDTSSGKIVENGNKMGKSKKSKNQIKINSVSDFSNGDFITFKTMYMSSNMQPVVTDKIVAKIVEIGRKVKMEVMFGNVRLGRQKNRYDADDYIDDFVDFPPGSKIQLAWSDIMMPTKGADL